MLLTTSEHSASAVIVGFLLFRRLEKGRILYGVVKVDFVFLYLI